ncbi:hypothetical protein O5264_29380, partial [Escherichia coli]|nr:hypothetical protein [Escherichia coli]
RLSNPAKLRAYALSEQLKEIMAPLRPLPPRRQEKNPRPRYFLVPAVIDFTRKSMKKLLICRGVFLGFSTLP